MKGNASMSDVNALLSQRLKKGDHTSKMAEMAKQSASGNLTSFTGVFSISELNGNEKAFLENILKTYANGNEDLGRDLDSLISITSEVKAINNQAAILHGERIKKAHAILTNYRDGAFTAWLIAAYGNRQTPYNFMQYYEFYEAMPKLLRPRIEAMPRQAIYTLASRDGPLEKKKEIVESYQGQSKNELLGIIRETFPLDIGDKRRENLGESAIQGLNKIIKSLRSQRASLTKPQKKALENLVGELQSLLETF